MSAMGAGSTLLRLMLDSHENIAIPHETGFMRIYVAMRSTPFKWSGRSWARRLGWSDEDLDAEARAFFERIFMRYADAHGKRRWGEKTPQHTWHMARMRRVFPDAVFVSIVRHPGAATVSNMRRFGHTAPWGTVHTRRYYKELARQAERFPNRMVTLRYEDLVLQPERTMRELLDWLGEPWSDSVLQHHEVQSAREHDRIEGLTKAGEPIDATRIAAWEQSVSPEDRALIVKRLTPMAGFFGYSFDDPTALAPLSETGGLLFGGEEVGRRIDAHQHIDIRTRGEVPINERLFHPKYVQLYENQFGGLRFKPGQTDPLAPPPPGFVERRVTPVVRALPAPVRRRVWRAARRVGLRARKPWQRPAPRTRAEEPEPEV